MINPTIPFFISYSHAYLIDVPLPFLLRDIETSVVFTIRQEGSCCQATGTDTLGRITPGDTRMTRLKVKEVAETKHFSQRKLSMRSGVDIRTMQRIWRDPYKIVTTETLDKIAKVLGVDISELVETVPDE